MPLKILLVEDNESTQKMVELTFDSENVEIIIAVSGDEALIKVREEIPDLMIVDSDITGLSGMELSLKIKEDPDLNIIPILFLVSSLNELNPEQQSKSRADAFLFKPFKSNELTTIVSNLTGVNLENSDEEDFDEEDETDNRRMEIEESIDEDDDSFDIIKDLTEVDTVILKPEDEVDDEQVKEAMQDSVEIFPEDILEDDEKDIDFSDILGLEDDELENNADALDENVITGSKTEHNLADSLLADKKLKSIKKENVGYAGASYSDSADSIKENIGGDLNKAVLSKLLGEQFQLVIENILNNITKDVLKDAIESSIKEALQVSFNDISPKLVKVIEEISWEIIPDLAEVLIKKEIEKLKKGI